jgi:pyruvate dehydrogenase E2 component (dihydrolipoamide acetyltransferase)
MDMTETRKFREGLPVEMREKASASISYTDILVKAVALAIKKIPIVNSTLEGDRVKIMKDINIGVAVAADEGLVVPVVRNADRKSLLQIASTLEDLSRKAKNRTLSMDEVVGGTFTISNLGMFNVDTFSPIINPPQSSILGVGAIKEKPVAVSGRVIIRSIMTLSLVFDHRILDGASAAVFLGTIKEILENFLTYKY